MKKRYTKDIKIMDKKIPEKPSAMTEFAKLSKEFYLGDGDLKNLLSLFTQLKKIFTSKNFNGSEGIDFINFAIEQSKEFFDMKPEIFEKSQICKLVGKLCKRYIRSCTKKMIRVNNEKIILENLCNFQEIIDLLNPLYNDMKRDVDFENLELVHPKRESISHVLGTIGEIKHWILKIKKQDSLITAVKYYINSANMNPFDGKNFYLLSNCTISIGDIPGTLYYLCLSLFNENSYKCNIDFLKILDKVEIEFKKMQAEEIRPGFKKDIDWYMQAFYYSICSIFKIVFTERNRDKVKKHAIFSLEYLSHVLNKAKHEKFSKENFLKLLKHSFVLISSLMFIAEEENDLLPDDFFKIEVQILEDLVIGFLPLIFNCLDFFFDQRKFLLQKSLESYLPLISFLTKRDYIVNLIVINMDENLVKKVKNFIRDFEEEIECNWNEEYSYLVSSPETFFLGFSPLKMFYSDLQKLRQNGNSSLNNTILVKKFLDLFKKFQNVDETHLQNLKEKLISSNYTFVRDTNMETQKLLEEFQGTNQINRNISMTTEKKIIVIDGCNVAIRYGKNKFMVEGIEICINYWRRKGHEAIVILPDYCFSLSEIQRRRKNPHSGSTLKKLPDNVEKLLEMRDQNIAFPVPNKDYDDSYMLQYAKDSHGYVISNDKFNDHIRSYGDRSHRKKKEVKHWILNNVISYAFIGVAFVPNPDFMKEHFLDV